MRRLQKGGAHFFLNGIRFRVFGDPTTEYCKNMMLVAQIDLQKLKDRSDESLTIIDHEVGPYFRVRSRNGQDEIYIYPEVGAKERVVEREIVIPEEREEVKVEYLPAFEVYNESKEQIGYVICESGTFNAPYTLILTDNVIDPWVGRDEAEIVKAASPAITVDPFLWPMWKYWFTDYYGEPELRPFDTETLEDKEILRQSSLYPDKEVKVIYRDIACKFEELLIKDLEWPDQTYDLDYGYGEPYLYWLPVYSGLPDGSVGDDMWKCGAVWAAFVSYDGHIYSYYPDGYIRVTEAGWTNEDGIYQILDGVESTKYERSSNYEDATGTLKVTDPNLSDYIPVPRTPVYSSDCKNWTGAWYDDEPYWAYATDPLTRPVVAYGNWCDSQGCWDECYVIAMEFVNNTAVTPQSFPDTRSWEYYIHNYVIYESYKQYDLFGNAKDKTEYAGYFQFLSTGIDTIKEMRETYDPRSDYFKQWNECKFPLGEAGCTFADLRYPLSEELDDVQTVEYYHKQYIEVNGAAGLDEKLIYESADTGYGVRARDGNVRFYKLSEDSYWVLAALWLVNPDWEQDKLLYVTYRSDKGFLEDAEFLDERLYGLISPDYIFYLHEIDSGLVAPDGGKVLAQGAFRLIERTTKTKYFKTERKVSLGSYTIGE